MAAGLPVGGGGAGGKGRFDYVPGEGQAVGDGWGEDGGGGEDEWQVCSCS